MKFMLLESSRERIAVIDGLRAVLCFMVVQEHLTSCYNHVFHTSFFDQYPFYFLYDGKAAVSGFFVLSGFVLSLRYTSYVTSVKDYFHYILKRALRLYPAYWVALVITFIVYLLLYNSGYAELVFIDHALLTFSSDWTVYIHQFFLVISPEQLMLPQTWSLYFEMSCSLALPLLLWGLRKNKIIFILLYLLALKLNVHWYTLHFIIGAMLVEYHHDLNKIWNALPAFIKYTLLLLALLLFTVNNHISFLFALLPGTIFQPLVFYEYEISQLLNGIGFALLLAIVINSSKGTGVLRNKILTTAGRYSYSIFLIHPLVITLVALLYRLTGVPAANLLSVLSMYGIVYLSCYMIASWMWRAIEQPMIKAKK